MKLEIKGNQNYVASIVDIQNIIELENCDNIQATSIFGNTVIIGKDIKEGDIGIFFPVETKICNEFLSKNNLYEDKELNIDKDKKGFFNKKGRVRCVKLRGNKSEGFWIPIKNIEVLENVKVEDFKIGDEFDTIDGNTFCEKYVVITNQPSNNKKKNEKKLVESRILDKYWKFHEDTAQLYRNLDKLHEDCYVDVSFKMHGTSLCCGYIPVKRKLNIFESMLNFLKVKITDTEYDYVWSSRKVIKNKEFNKKQGKHYYDLDIWGLAFEKIKSALQKDMMIYAEIVGYLPNGTYIQSDYDYGCEKGKFEVYVYRITYTNNDGIVYEFTPRQIREYCNQHGIKYVPNLFYGTVKNLFNILCYRNKIASDSFDKNLFLNLLKEEYLEKDCTLCTSIVPAEGVVLRLDKNYIEAYKLKANRFYERETKFLDKGEVDIEESQEDISE